jgi:hypothetical protein
MANPLHEFQPGVFARLHEERTVEGRLWVYRGARGWLSPRAGDDDDDQPPELQTRRDRGAPAYGTYLRPRLGGGA